MRSSRSTLSTISARLLLPLRSNMATWKTTIGATCLRLRLRPRLACFQCWALRFRSPLARSHFRGVSTMTESLHVERRDSGSLRPRRRRCLPTSHPWRRPRRSLSRPLLRPTQLSSNLFGRSGGGANPGGRRPQGPSRASLLSCRQRPRLRRQRIRWGRRLPLLRARRPGRFLSRQRQPLRPPLFRLKR
jgi:hypothetical protein